MKALVPVASWDLEVPIDVVDVNCSGGSRIFLGGGALVSSSTSTPINNIVFFCRIPVVLENRRSSQGGGGAHPLHPPPRSAPELSKFTNHDIPGAVYTGMRY